LIDREEGTHPPKKKLIEGEMSPLRTFSNSVCSQDLDIGAISFSEEGTHFSLYESLLPFRAIMRPAIGVWRDVP